MDAKNKYDFTATESTKPPTVWARRTSLIDETPGCNLTSEQWNMLYQIGQKVLCYDDNGGTFESHTTSHAWRLGHSDIFDRETAMVSIDRGGQETGWCLNFIEVIE